MPIVRFNVINGYPTEKIWLAGMGSIHLSGEIMDDQCKSAGNIPFSFSAATLIWTANRITLFDPWFNVAWLRADE